MEFNKKQIRQQLQATYPKFARELHYKLSRYGVTERVCYRIARLRLCEAIYQMRDNRNVFITKTFPSELSYQRAANIYNAYIRHWRTGTYDKFYAKVMSSLSDGARLEKKEVRKLWRMQCPNDFEEYEKKCIIIDERGNRIIGGHLTNY